MRRTMVLEDAAIRYLVFLPRLPIDTPPKPYYTRAKHGQNLLYLSGELSRLA
jgi:hypothetical protein